MSGRISTPRCACWSKADTGSTFQNLRIAPDRCAAGGRSFRQAWSIRRAAELDRLVTTYAPFAARGVPIVGLEPSCLLTLRDELLSLRSDNDARSISAHALLFEEFLVREAEAGRLRAAAWRYPGQGAGSRPLPSEIIRRVQAGRKGASPHSRPRASRSSSPVAAAWPAPSAMAPTPTRPRWKWPNSRCCRRCAARTPTTLIVADGTSCRHQIKDGSERAALHVARVLAMSLDRARPNSTALPPAKEPIHG